MKVDLPNPERPLMMIRFRIGQEEPDLWRRTLKIIKENRACFDEVWFSTGVGFPKLEDHRKWSRNMAAAADDLRKLGVIPSLQIQTTIGHGDEIIAFSGADGKNWGSYVGRNGEQCRYVNCPRQPGFLKYMSDVSEIYAQWHPGSVWIDDDLRLSNHSPAASGDGCYCKDCLALFAEEEGHLYTREELVTACETNPELKRRWMDFCIRSLSGIARVIAESFHRISPETRLGLQHNADISRTAVFDTLKQYSGHRSASRPGGGTYTDSLPFTIIDKGILCSVQKNQQQGYDVLDQVCPEIESCPRTFTCKTPQGHRLESLCYLALGMDSLSYFIMDPLLETPEWYGENLLAPLAAETPAYKEYTHFNEGTEPGGAGVPQQRLSCEELGFPLIGTAFAGASPANCCFLITRQCAENCSDKELERCLKGNIIVNAAAVAVLEKRGFEKYTGSIRAVPAESGLRPVFAEHPLCRGFENKRFSTFNESPCRFEYPDSPGFQTVTHFEDRNGKRCGAETVLYTRPDGTRAAFMGTSFSIRFLSTSRVMLMNRIADWVSHEKMPVLTEQPLQLTVIPRITGEGLLRSITLINPTIGPMKPFTLILRNIPEKASARWIVPASSPVNLPLSKENGQFKITVPGLAAWDIGFIEFFNAKD